MLESLGKIASKYGLFPAIAILALLLGGYGCYQAKNNEAAIQALSVEQARTEARLDSNTKELSGRMEGVEKSLVELTTQIKLLIDGKINLGATSKK